METRENEIQVRVSQEIERFISNPMNVIQAYDKALKSANLQIEVLRPKAEMFDIAMSSESLVEMSAVSKTLNFKGMGRNNLFAYLREKKILRYNDEPYQSFVDRGFFKLTPQTFYMNGDCKVRNKTMTTQKGIDYIAKLLPEDGYELNAR